MVHIEQQNLGQVAFLFENRQIEPGLGSVIEEDRADDNLIGNGGIEGDVRDAEDGFDIRDLLLDETD